MILVPAERIAEYKARGWWSEQRFDDLLLAHAARTPEAEALVDPPNLPEISGLAPQRLSWGEVAEAVRRRAALLHAEGLGKDDVVIVQLPNSVEQTLLYLACWRLGVIVSPVPAQYRLNELSGIARRVDAKAAITTARIGRHAHGATMLELQRQIPSLRRVFIEGEAEAPGIALGASLAALDAAALAAGDRAAAEAGVCADDVATICWTSGTEADPKGVPRSHNEWIVVAGGCIAAAHLAPAARVLNPFPMVNMAGMTTGLVTWLATGGTLVQHHPFDLQVFLAQLRDEEIDYTVGAPPLLNTLLNNRELLAGVNFDRLKRIGSGAAPLSEHMVRGFQEQFGVHIINLFGSNEGACFAATEIDVPDAAVRAVCFPRLPMDGVQWEYAWADRIETRLVDVDTEEEVRIAGHPGELRVRGPTVFSGYWRAPDITARAFDADGWFKTGDLFEITGPDDRFFRFVGRHKDIVIRGGMNISANEIENHLLDHPLVADVAVIGWPDPDMGERLCACIVSREPGLSLAELNRFLTEEKQVAVFKQIERLQLMTDLPRNPVGKVLKRELRAQATQGEAP